MRGADVHEPGEYVAPQEPARVTGASGLAAARSVPHDPGPLAPATVEVRPRLRDVAELRARRNRARRNRRLARIDVGVGVALAIVLLLIAPGLAIVALIALLALGSTVVSLLFGRLRRRRERGRVGRAAGVGRWLEGLRR